MKLLLPVILIFSIHYFPNLVRAEQSISVEWSRSEAYLEGQSRRHFYEPETGTLYYSLALDESWRLGASLWSGVADEVIGDLGHRLDQTHSGGSIYVNHMLGNWGISVALSRARSELLVRSPASTLSYQEETQSSDINFAFDYLFSFERLDFVPSLGLGFQQSELEAERELVVPGSIDIKDRKNEDQRGGYAFVGVDLNTWFELGREIFLLPAIQVGWSEALSSDSHFSASRHNLTQGSLRALNLDGSGELDDGSGYLGLSLALLIEGCQVRLSYTETLAQDVNTASTGIEFGLSL